MNFEKLNLQPIYLNSQNNLFKKNIFKNLFYNLYKNVRFSTFPYFSYKVQNSLNSLKQYNSGNCVSMCYFIQIYLKNNYNIDSYIIGASVPDQYKVNNTPHICHCAVLIPKSDTEFFIIDGAFYFIQPIYCNLNNNKERSIYYSNIYNHNNLQIEYKIENVENELLDENYSQILLPKSLCVSCNFKNDRSQQWNYYLNNVMNPDESIGNYFLQSKKLPFILFTEYDTINNIVKLSYKLYLNEDGEIIIKEYPMNKIIFKGDKNELIDSNMKEDVLNKMINHFENYF